MTHISLLGKLATSAALVVLAAGAGASVVVPGTANPWLAGMPDGSGASSGDVAPDQSPVLVTGVPLVAGTALQFFNVSGGVLNTGDCPTTCIGPDGDVAADFFGYTARFDFGYGAGENGMSALSAPFNALVGVYLGADQPDGLLVLPAALDFQAAGIGINFGSLSPTLQQVFYIGDGLTGTGSGAVQSFAVPDGATRLYLGVLDGFGWNNNSGAFALDVGVVPEPAMWQLWLLSLAGLAAMRGRPQLR